MRMTSTLLFGRRIRGVKVSTMMYISMIRTEIMRTTIMITTMATMMMMTILIISKTCRTTVYRHPHRHNNSNVERHPPPPRLLLLLRILLPVLVLRAVGCSPIAVTRPHYGPNNDIGNVDMKYMDISSLLPRNTCSWKRDMDDAFYQYWNNYSP